MPMINFPMPRRGRRMERGCATLIQKFLMNVCTRMNCTKEMICKMFHNVNVIANNVVNAFIVIIISILKLIYMASVTNLMNLCLLD